MAIGQARLCLLIGRSSSLLTRPGSLLARPINLVAPVAAEGQRHLTTHPQYKKPYPYKTRKFTFWHALLEYTVARINENSRILTIEGPPCVGKTEFAKKLADHFQLKYFPAITDDDLFIVNGFDMRQLNEMMPIDRMRSHDLDMFYAEPDPKNMLGFGGTQIEFFTKRYYQYIEALKHVLHTGQGVILESNVWGDACYALNLADHGYFTKKGIRWYMEHRKKTLNFLWKPHLVIHLDAPSSYVVKQMKEKHPQLENSPVLTEKYFDGLREKYQQFYMPFMNQHCETLTYDITNMEDFELLAMDIESMDLISARFGEGVRFADWKKGKEEFWSLYRVAISDPRKVDLACKWRAPYNCPELMLSGEEKEFVFDLMLEIPQLKYDNSYWQDKYGNFTPRPELHDVTPLSLAKDDPRYNQGLTAKQIAA